MWSGFVWLQSKSNDQHRMVRCNVFMFSTFDPLLGATSELEEVPAGVHSFVQQVADPALGSPAGGVTNMLVGVEEELVLTV